METRADFPLGGRDCYHRYGKIQTMSQNLLHSIFRSFQSRLFYLRLAHQNHLLPALLSVNMLLCWSTSINHSLEMIIHWVFFYYCSVFGGGEVIATGENHTLTTTYLENRRRMFESRRDGFTQESAPTTTPSNRCIASAQCLYCIYYNVISKRIPTCHFLYFKDGTKQGLYICSEIQH